MFLSIAVFLPRGFKASQPDVRPTSGSREHLQHRCRHTSGKSHAGRHWQSLLQPKYPKYEILCLFDVFLQPRSGDQGAGPLIRRSQGPLGRGPLGLQAAHRKPETRRRGRLSGLGTIHVLLFLDGIPPPKVAEFKSEVELSSEVARLSPARLISPGRAPLGEYRTKIPDKQLLKTL